MALPHYQLLQNCSDEQLQRICECRRLPIPRRWDDGPEGRKGELNLPLARHHIDLVAMLQEKTKGNLTPEEEKDLTENRSRRFRMEFPVVIDKDLDRLKDKKLRMDAAVKCTTEGEELKKAAAFQLKF